MIINQNNSVLRIKTIIKLNQEASIVSIMVIKFTLSARPVECICVCEKVLCISGEVKVIKHFGDCFVGLKVSLSVVDNLKPLAYFQLLEDPLIIAFV